MREGTLGPLAQDPAKHSQGESIRINFLSSIRINHDSVLPVCYLCWLRYFTVSPQLSTPASCPVGMVLASRGLIKNGRRTRQRCLRINSERLVKAQGCRFPAEPQELHTDKGVSETGSQASKTKTSKFVKTSTQFLGEELKEKTRTRYKEIFDTNDTEYDGIRSTDWFRPNLCCICCGNCIYSVCCHSISNIRLSKSRVAEWLKSYSNSECDPECRFTRTTSRSLIACIRISLTVETFKVRWRYMAGSMKI